MGGNRFAFGFFRQIVARGQGFGGNAAEQFCRRFERGGGVDVADDDQRSVVGRVPLFIPCAQVVRLERVQVVHIADNRRAQGGYGEAVEVDVFPQFARRVVFRALAAFFPNHVHLVGKVFVAEIQVLHPVGFELQHFRQLG